MEENYTHRDVAIMLYPTSKEDSDLLHSKYLKQYNFPRCRYSKSKHYTDYHLTLGYLRDLHVDHMLDFISYLEEALPQVLNLENTIFEFGAASLFGSSSKPSMVAIPININTFTKYNLSINDTIENYEYGKFKLERKTKPRFYFPHINFYATLHKHIEITDVPKILSQLDTSLKGFKLPLGTLRVIAMKGRKMRVSA